MWSFSATMGCKCLVRRAISDFRGLIPNHSSLSFSNKLHGNEKVEFCGCFRAGAVECIGSGAVEKRRSKILAYVQAYEEEIGNEFTQRIYAFLEEK